MNVVNTSCKVCIPAASRLSCVLTPGRGIALWASFLLTGAIGVSLAVPMQPTVVPSAATVLGTERTAFTVNQRSTFLLGISYYGGLGASEAQIRADLKAMRQAGFNWLRVWATWGAYGQEVSAVDGEGRPRQEYLTKLQFLVAEADRLGLIVDVTLSRGNGVTGPARLTTAQAHRQAVETVTKALRNHRNWYLDVANERNIKDARFTTYEELKALRAAARAIAPHLLVTASHAGDISRQELQQYLQVAQVDFLAPHRPRHPDSPKQTQAKTRELLRWAAESGRTLPVHYQEPFRRGWGRWEPTAEDFLTDLRGAQAGGAAGWCFHNGDQRSDPEGKPRRCFDLRGEAGLWDRLDDVEREAIRRLTQHFKNP